MHIERIKSLIRELNAASNAYYNTDTPTMSNRQWDEKYDELKQLEQETGVVLSASPTQNIGYGTVSKFLKEEHEIPALSLNKTKSVDELQEFFGGRECVMSWKMDGLTIVTTYEDGKLIKAVTRGNGMIGEVITENAKAFEDLPLSIPDKGKIIVRGEAIITYADFEKINASLPVGKKQYDNPRNLCVGSVRQQDANVTKSRHVHFCAFSMTADKLQLETKSSQFEYLKQLGFTPVDYVVIPKGAAIAPYVKQFESQVSKNPFPSDGLVLSFNDIAYGKSLGQTSKFPRDSIAFKWKDELKETTLREIEWSPSRTGLINPVAVFDPVELEGTTVTRASVHNVGILNDLALTPGDTVTVYKANMIIPQIEENLTRKGIPVIPCSCPACGGKTEITVSEDGAKALVCRNADCPAKQIGAFCHAVGRDALNIEGLSEETLTKFMDAGLLSSLPDLFRLKERKAEIVGMEGFGEKSYEKLTASIEAARKTSLDRLLYALGIEFVGRTASKAICRHFKDDVIAAVNAKKETLLMIDGIGDAIASSYADWFKNQCNMELFEGLLSEVILEKRDFTEPKGSAVAGKVFVITGTVKHFENRSAFKTRIEMLGGKVTGSVSKNTDYLINNDITSTSSKNKKAKELGIPIITEEEYLAME